MLDVSLDGSGVFPAGYLLGAPGAVRNVPGRHAARGATLGGRHRGPWGVRPKPRQIRGSAREGISTQKRAENLIYFRIFRVSIFAAAKTATAALDF